MKQLLAWYRCFHIAPPFESTWECDQGDSGMESISLTAMVAVIPLLCLCFFVFQRFRQ